jgi:hypothetical protein
MNDGAEDFSLDQDTDEVTSGALNGGVKCKGSSLSEGDRRIANTATCHMGRHHPQINFVQYTQPIKCRRKTQRVLIHTMSMLYIWSRLRPSLPSHRAKKAAGLYTLLFT